jgi:hypothetical protein
VYRFAGLNFLVTCFFPLKSSTFIFPTTTNTKIIQYLKLTMTSKLVFFQYPNSQNLITFSIWYTNIPLLFGASQQNSTHLLLLS